MSNSQIERNGHEWAEERLSDYIDDRLPFPERNRLEQHLQGCERCQASLASLRWTVSLLKRAPAPTPSRSFFLPMEQKPAGVPLFGLAALRFATALATLLLVSLIGIDLILQFGGANATARPAARPLSPPHVALSQPSASSASDQSVGASSAATAPLPLTPGAAATVAPTPAAKAQSTVAPAGAQPFRSAGPTSTPTYAPIPGGSGERTASAKSATENGSPTRPGPLTLGVVPTAAPPEPTQTPTSPAVPPTATPAPATATPSPGALESKPFVPPPSGPSTSAVLPAVRIGELALLFLAVFLGSLTVMVGRRSRTGKG